ncbi:MAG: UDP-N-acetylmuramoyl-tripeptide--D-alanyl-D-alanine ligase [Clostridia bacterium]|jgi:UDP-N-acetylmuramoyl-tripeptide--D-alanyl-D-alanine ligase|nr:murF [Clostridiales bacterium]MDK2985624.1 UDP-N-acetylmuramoyl-tripeptide--D-alanyl-D-alanine ligase [Clostridia bacterium]
MKKKISDIVKITNGELVSGNKDKLVTGITTDSRKVESGDLFVALTGEKFDGHNFVNTALEKGAGAAVIEKEHKEKFKMLNYPVIAVENTLQALGAIAHSHRKQFRIPVVAITGSNGKTTTKDMVSSVLQQKFNIIKTEGNYNNEIGLPLTLLKIAEDTQAAVVEMAMRGLGQIKYLCEIASPDVGIITNIGPVHYELLGSMENIAKAKGELIEGLPDNGLAIVNGEDTWCRRIASSFSGRIITYGFSKESAIRAEKIKLENFSTSFELHFKEEKVNIHLPLPGEHNVLNSLAAAAVGIYFGLSLQEIAQGLNSVKISSMRLEVTEGPRKSIIINDSYNANPVSVKASLNVLSNMSNGRKIAVFGDMLELGQLAVEGHREVGKTVSQYKLDYLITVGNLAQEIAREAIRTGMPQERVYQFDETEAAAKILSKILIKDDIVLIKGSRSMKMEEILLRLS